MNYYTRKQVIELLEIDEGFLLALEREEIVLRDAPGGEAAEFSERMLERVRVAQNLVADLEVNLPGVAVILGMREEMSDLRQRVAELVHELRRGSRGG